jgi:hypothetical protein
LDFVIISKTGREKLNVAPEEGMEAIPSAEPITLLFLAQIFPPCTSIIFLDIYRPNPVPESEPETNFVKRF